MTNLPIPDAWILDSGLRDDMVISIHGAYFAPHADYQSGDQLMIWFLGVDESEDPVEIRMSIGSDWQTSDGGNTVQHPTKKKQHINQSSIYGHFIKHAFDIPELANVLIERSAAYPEGPRNAKIWMGLVIHLQNKTLHWGGDINDQERLMPTEYIGLVADYPTATTPTPTPAPAPAPVPTPQQAAVSAAPSSAQELVAAARAQAAQQAVASNGSPLYARAVEMAKVAPDFATFVGQAFADADILADDELAEQCADESGIWAQAH